MAKITYFVPNISCGHCVHTIKTELEELAGVTPADVSALEASGVVFCGDGQGGATKGGS